MIPYRIKHKATGLYYKLGRPSLSKVGKVYGTCVTHEFPNIGKDIGAVPVLKELVEKGHKIILYTMRSHPDKNNQGKTLSGETIANDTLQDAIDWFEKNGIPLWGINENPKQKEWTSSPKIFANIYIDDAALGMP